MDIMNSGQLHWEKKSWGVPGNSGYCILVPIGSMVLVYIYIYANIWGILMVNVSIYIYI